MQVAEIVALRSKCINRKAGAVVVTKDNRIAAVGYNGPPRGMSANGPCTNWCERAGLPPEQRGNDYSNCPAVHCEPNALMAADRSLIDNGSIYVVTGMSCLDCAKIVSNSGLARAIFRAKNTHPSDVAVGRVDSSVAFYERCGIEVVFI